MNAEYFTKPLQGQLFKKLRDYIMGRSVIPPEERVENNLKKNKNNLAVGKTVNGHGETYAEIVKGKEKVKDVEQY